jgi:hypothetical protein
MPACIVKIAIRGSVLCVSLKYTRSRCVETTHKQEKSSDILAREVHF